MNRYTHAQWLARNAHLIRQSGGAQQPEHFALPGAFAAIHRDRLEAHMQVGKTAHEVTARVNETWVDTPAARRRLRAHRTWLRRYERQIADHKRAEELRAALNAARSAQIEAAIKRGLEQDAAS